MSKYKNSKDINFPDELVEHIRKDELLIFCGSGVSRDAGLPMYKGLLDEIAKTV